MHRTKGQRGTTGAQEIGSPQDQRPTGDNGAQEIGRPQDQRPIGANGAFPLHLIQYIPLLPSCVGCVTAGCTVLRGSFSRRGKRVCERSSNSHASDHPSPSYDQKTPLGNSSKFRVENYNAWSERPLVGAQALDIWALHIHFVGPVCG